MFKFVMFLILATAIQLAHSYDASPAITTQHQNVLRSFDNLGQVTTFSKTLDTPFSSVRKSDIRINNPGLTVASPAYTALAHPAFGSNSGYAFPPSYATIPGGYSSGIHQTNYPVHANYPVLPAYSPYQNGQAILAGPPPAAVYHPTAGLVAQKTIVPGGAGLLGVAYSPATSVSHMTFADGLGLTYSW